MHGKQEIECQGALFAPDGGLRVSLRGTERQRERGTKEKIIKQKKRERKRRRGEEIRIIKGRENTDAEIPSDRWTENREAFTPKGCERVIGGIYSWRWPLISSSSFLENARDTVGRKCDFFLKRGAFEVFLSV